VIPLAAREVVDPETLAALSDVWSLPHRVEFANDKPTMCWGDRDERNIRCDKPGTSRLGLCPEHVGLILGDPPPQ
jgi:hypothetical protein